MSKTIREIDEQGCLAGKALHDEALLTVKQLKSFIVGCCSVLSVVVLIIAGLLAWVMLDAKTTAMTEIDRSSLDNRGRIDAYTVLLSKEGALKEKAASQEIEFRDSATVQRIMALEKIAVENQKEIKQMSYDMIRLNTMLLSQDLRQGEILAILKGLQIGKQ